MKKVYALLCGLLVLLITGLCALGVLHLFQMYRQHTVVAPSTVKTSLAATPLNITEIEPGDSGSLLVRFVHPNIILIVVHHSVGEKMETGDSGSFKFPSVFTLPETHLLKI